MKGLSCTNLLYMRAFAEAWPDEAIVQQLAGQIPWFHNCILLDKVKDETERLWYVRQTREQGGSRNVLVHQIESGLYVRQGKALTNFSRTLREPDHVLKGTAKRLYRKGGGTHPPFLPRRAFYTVSKALLG